MQGICPGSFRLCWQWKWKGSCGGGPEGKNRASIQRRICHEQGLVTRATTFVCNFFSHLCYTEWKFMFYYNTDMSCDRSLTHCTLTTSILVTTVRPFLPKYEYTHSQPVVAVSLHLVIRTWIFYLARVSSSDVSSEVFFAPIQILPVMFFFCFFFFLTHIEKMWVYVMISVRLSVCPSGRTSVRPSVSKNLTLDLSRRLWYRAKSNFLWL